MIVNGRWVHLEGIILGCLGQTNFIQYDNDKNVASSVAQHIPMCLVKHLLPETKQASNSLYTNFCQETTVIVPKSYTA